MLIYRTKTASNRGKYRFIIGIRPIQIPDPKKMFHDPGGARNSAVDPQFHGSTFRSQLSEKTRWVATQMFFWGVNTPNPGETDDSQFDGVEVVWLVWHPVGLVGRCTQRNCHRTGLEGGLVLGCKVLSLGFFRSFQGG